MVDMKQRTISAIVLLIILIGSLVISSKLFGIVMLLLAILGFNEFFDIKYKDGDRRLNTIRVFGIISLEKENEDFSFDEKLIFKTCASIISNLIKDLELSKVLKMQVEALQSGIITSNKSKFI